MSETTIKALDIADRFITLLPEILRIFAVEMQQNIYNLIASIFVLVVIAFLSYTLISKIFLYKTIKILPERKKAEALRLKGLSGDQWLKQQRLKFIFISFLILISFFFLYFINKKPIDRTIAKVKQQYTSTYKPAPSNPNIPESAPVDSQAAEPVPVNPQVPEPVPISSQVPKLIPIKLEIPKIVPIKSEVSELTPVKLEIPETKQVNNGTLEVLTVPGNAQVEILNIKTPYKKGMLLKAGRYRLRVSAEKYITQEQLVTINQKENIVKFELKPQKFDSVTDCISLLKSSVPEKKKEGAKLAFEKYNNTPKILTVVEKQLSHGYKNYHPNINNSNHIEAMKYLCLTLGASKNKKYKSLLTQVSFYSSSSAIKQAAESALSELN